MEICGLPIDNYHRPIARYEIRFILLARAQEFKGVFPGVALRQIHGKPPFAIGYDTFECAVILPAYTAEDALTDLRARLECLGWYTENIRVESVLPTDHTRPELDRRSSP